MKIGDKILIIVILLGTIFLFGMQVRVPSGANYAIVTQNGSVIKEFKCSQDEIINLQLRSGAMRLEVNDGRVRVTDAHCPEQVCVHSGWIRRTGQSIICVPNKVVIELKGSQPVEYDGLAY